MDNKRKENLENQARLDTQRGWQADAARLEELESRPRLRRRRPSQVRALKGLAKAKNKRLDLGEAEDLMEEPPTEKSATRARDGY